ncbi:MAG TPA: aminoglycoside phosphotransferase family protein [Actinomycetota bacterium]
MTAANLLSEIVRDGATPRTIRDALIGQRMRGRLRAVLTSMLANDAILESCRIERAKFKPGRSLTMHMAVRARADPHPETRSVAVRWHLGDGLHGDRSAEAVEPDAGCASVAEAITRPFGLLHRRAPDLHAEILVSPFDPQLPQLHRLADPDVVDRMLTPHGHRPRRSSVRTVRYRPGERHVLAYVPREPAPGSTGAVFAKLGRDEDPRRTSALLRHAADILEAWDASATAARPLRDEDGALLLAAVEGWPLSTMLRRDHADGVRAVYRVGQALRALHAGSGDAWPASKIAQPPTLVARRASEHIGYLLPDVGIRIVEMLDRADAAFEAVGEGASTLVHGDMKADHVFIGRGRMSFLDFGASGSGDPMVDVGKFLADLRWWRSPRSSAAGRQLRTAFLRGYGFADGSVHAVRARAWESVLFLSISAHRVPLWDLRWERWTRSLVDEAERCLHEMALVT